MKKSTDTILNIIAVILGLVFIAIIWTLSMWSMSYGCSSRWDGTYETKYAMFSGCRVNVNGKWIPERSVREFMQ